MYRGEGGVSSYVLIEEHRIGTMKAGRILFGIIIVLFGLIFLLNNMGILPWDFWPQLIQLWPVLLIVIGLRIAFPRGPLALLSGLVLILAVILALIYAQDLDMAGVKRISGDFEQILDRTVSEGVFSFRFGASNIDIQSVNDDSPATIGSLLYHIEYSVIADRRPIIGYRVAGNRVYVDFEYGQKSVWIVSEKLFQGKTGNNVDIWLHRGVEWELNFDVGASRINADLSRLPVSKLRISSGAGDIDIKLGSIIKHSEVSVSTGASDVRISVPLNTGVKVVVSSPLSSSNLKYLDFVQRDGAYYSPDYNQAEQTVDIYFSSGVGKFELDWSE